MDALGPEFVILPNDGKAVPRVIITTPGRLELQSFGSLVDRFVRWVFLESVPGNDFEVEGLEVVVEHKQISQV